MLNGRLSERLVSDTQGITDWSFVEPGDLALINQPIDVLGLNYYSSDEVRMRDHAGDDNPTAWPGSRNVEFVPTRRSRTAMGWGIVPEGLETLLVSLSTEFPDLPLMVTENGAAFDDVEERGAVHDEDRVAYLSQHFDAALRAIDRGVDLRGYLVWSLIDNFEWALGYAKRFGIIRVDYETLERTVKDSGTWLADVISSQPRSRPLVEHN